MKTSTLPRIAVGLILGLHLTGCSSPSASETSETGGSEDELRKGSAAAAAFVAAANGSRGKVHSKDSVTTRCVSRGVSPAFDATVVSNGQVVFTWKDEYGVTTGLVVTDGSVEPIISRAGDEFDLKLVMDSVGYTLSASQAGPGTSSLTGPMGTIPMTCDLL